mgnify:CR=1 FL=1
MKTEVLQSLLVARTLYDQARVLLYSENKYSTSAALVILQDAFELIMKAALIEKGIDEFKSFEKLSFDDIIGLLRSHGVTVAKSGTLKAMNRERVNVKHYGQLAEHGTVQNFFDASEVAHRAIMDEVFGKNLGEIYASDLIRDESVRRYISDAETFIAKGNTTNALFSVRKAIFISIEAEYDIAAYADPDHVNTFPFLARGGHSPYHTRNAKWIADNVREPFDYIQLNVEKIKIDLMEWGVNTQDFWNIWRLTPKVYQANKDSDWKQSSLEMHEDRKNQLETARYCLDRAINLLLKKQQHQDVGRYRPWKPPTQKLLIIKDCPRLAKSHSNSNVIDNFKAGERVIFERKLDGLDGKGYYQLPLDFSNNEWHQSYVDAENCQL